MTCRYMTISDAAHALNISRERVHLWIKEGDLPVACVTERGSFLLSSATVETRGRELVARLHLREAETIYG